MDMMMMDDRRSRHMTIRSCRIYYSIPSRKFTTTPTQSPESPHFSHPCIHSIPISKSILRNMFTSTSLYLRQAYIRWICIDNAISSSTFPITISQNQKLHILFKGFATKCPDLVYEWREEMIRNFGDRLYALKGGNI